jgi:hypothetical protein
VLAVTVASPIAAAVLAMLDSLPPADRAGILRQQVTMIEAAAAAKRQSLAEITFAALAPLAMAYGIELIAPAGLAAPGSVTEDPEWLEIDLAMMVDALPHLVEALAAIEAGPAEHQRGPAMNGAAGV